MKLLVYGAGVIGSYLAHVLCTAGHDVSVLARGPRQAELEEKGLVIRHYLQRKTTTDRPRIISMLKKDTPYDAVFAVMQYQQMQSILDDLSEVDSPLVVLVGNNLSAPYMEEYIRTHSPKFKTVLFGFQATGGRRENGEMVCVHAGAGRLQCGLLHALPEENIQSFLAQIFKYTKYKPSYQPDMDAWSQCHLALILPIAYVCYALGCDLTRTTRAQLGELLEAAREGYGLLQSLGVPILPAGDEKYFAPGPRHTLMRALLWIMAKTALGRLAASDHCRNAVTEMEALDSAFLAIRDRSADYPMPHWDKLRRQMPDWETLRRQYGAAAHEREAVYE